MPRPILSLQRFAVAASYCLALTASSLQASEYYFEAENGVLQGVTLASDTGGFTGQGYVTGFDESGDTLTLPFHLDTRGRYHVVLRYAAPFGAKINTIQIDDRDAIAVEFPGTAIFQERSVVQLDLEAGSHVLKVSKDWGWVHIDAFRFSSSYTAPVNNRPPQIPEDPEPHALFFEAEHASWKGAEIQNEPGVTTIRSFLSGFTDSESAITWIVHPLESRTHRLGLRYRSEVEQKRVLGFADRTMDLHLPATHGDWKEIFWDLHLTAGLQRLHLESRSDAARLDIDRMQLTGEFLWPVPVFQAEAEAGDLGLYAFDARHSYAQPEGPLQFSWDFGDGTHAEGVQVKHRFQGASPVIVTLKVQDQNGQVRVQQQVFDWKKPYEKPRVIICTDSEIDDFSTFIRYLSRAPDYETLGMVVGNSRWQKDGGYAPHDNAIWFDYLNKYAAVQKLVSRHEAGWPSAEDLAARIYSGQKTRLGMAGVGAGMDTEGSRFIETTLLDTDPRPLWVSAWGGTDDLAQALFAIRERQPEALPHVMKKLKVFAITFQDVDSCNPDFASCADESGWWLLKEFPDLFLIRSHFVSAVNYQHLGHPYSKASFFSEEWMNHHVKQNHGPLGAAYPQSYFSEGDGPGVFFFFNKGLRGLENPSWGSWGGRYQRDRATLASARNFFEDADDRYAGQNHHLWALARWLPDIQNDLKARIDWHVQPYHKSNHEPMPVVVGGLNHSVRVGEWVPLSAWGSTDPDESDSLSVRWWQYDEVDTAGPIELKNPSHPTQSGFIVPNEPGKDIHIILELRDNGVPSLVRYQQVIFSIEP